MSYQSEGPHIPLSGTAILARLNGLGAVGAAFADDVFAIKGSSDATKKARFEVDGFTTGTTRVMTLPNADITIAGINLAQTWTAAQTINANLTVGTTGLLTVASDTDGTHIIGRMKIGTIASDVPAIAHFDQFALASFALSQTTIGDTYVNAASGRSLFFQINNTTKVTLTGSALTIASGVTTTFSDTTDTSLAGGGSVQLEGGLFAKKQVYGQYLASLNPATAAGVYVVSPDGSVASPTATTARNLGALDFYGHDGSSYQLSARILAVSEETWSGSARGTRLTFETTAAGSTSRTERMRVTSAGEVLIGTTTDAGAYQLQVVGSATACRLRTDATDGTALVLSAPGSTNNVLNFCDAELGGQVLGRAFLRWTRDAGDGRAFSIHVATGGGSTQAVTVTTAGRMLLGTTTDDGTNQLQVNGRFYATGSDWHHLVVPNGSAQLKLERTGSSTGSAFIGADSDGFIVYNAAISVKNLKLSDAGDLTIAGTTDATAAAGSIQTSGGIRCAKRLLFSSTSSFSGGITVPYIYNSGDGLTIIGGPGATYALSMCTNGGANFLTAYNGVTSVVAGNLGSLATNATDGFPYIPSCAGTPTGTPTTRESGNVLPLVIDRTNHKLYFYSGGAWRDAGP